jgi:hypothetical protein
MYAILCPKLHSLQTSFSQIQNAADQKIDYGAEYAGGAPIQTYREGTDAVLTLCSKLQDPRCCTG